jgi:hypothetical protein
MGEYKKYLAIIYICNAADGIGKLALPFSTLQLASPSVVSRDLPAAKMISQLGLLTRIYPHYRIAAKASDSLIL